MRTKKFGILCLVLLLTSCANLRRATRHDLDTVGTRDYRADRSKLVSALEGALKTIGYEITVEDLATGLIKTSKRLDRVEVSGSARAATATQLSNALTIRLEDRGDIQHVVVTPRGYLSTKEYPLEELNVGYAKDIWAQVFREVDDNLGTPGVSLSAE
jgi:hypothetical protein